MKIAMQTASVRPNWKHSQGYLLASDPINSIDLNQKPMATRTRSHKRQSVHTRFKENLIIMVIVLISSIWAILIS